MIRGTIEQEDLIIVNIASHLITQPQKDIKQQLTEMQGEIYKSTVIVGFNISHEKSGLDEAQAGIKIVGRNINNLRYADNTTLMAESDASVAFLRERRVFGLASAAAAAGVIPSVYASLKSTNSMIHISAASPRRKPVFKMRV